MDIDFNIIKNFLSSQEISQEELDSLTEVPDEAIDFASNMLGVDSEYGREIINNLKGSLLTNLIPNKSTDTAKTVPKTTPKTETSNTDINTDSDEFEEIKKETLDDNYNYFKILSEFYQTYLNYKDYKGSGHLSKFVTSDVSFGYHQNIVTGKDKFVEHTKTKNYNIEPHSVNIVDFSYSKDNNHLVVKCTYEVTKLDTQMMEWYNYSINFTDYITFNKNLISSCIRTSEIINEGNFVKRM